MSCNNEEACTERVKAAAATAARRSGRSAGEPEGGCLAAAICKKQPQHYVNSRWY